MRTFPCPAVAPCHSGRVVAPSVIVLSCLSVPATLPHCQHCHTPHLAAAEIRWRNYLALDQTTALPCKDLSILHSLFPALIKLTTDYLLTILCCMLHISQITWHVPRPWPVSLYNPHNFHLCYFTYGDLENMLVLKLPSLHCRNRETRLIRAHETIQGLLSVAVVVSWTAGPRQQRECSHGVKLEAELQTINR